MPLRDRGVRSNQLEVRLMLQPTEIMHGLWSTFVTLGGLAFLKQLWDWVQRNPRIIGEVEFTVLADDQLPTGEPVRASTPRPQNTAANTPAATPMILSSPNRGGGESGSETRWPDLAASCIAAMQLFA